MLQNKVKYSGSGLMIAMVFRENIGIGMGRSVAGGLLIFNGSCSCEGHLWLLLLISSFPKNTKQQNIKKAA